jgi:hypothetical protein
MSCSLEDLYQHWEEPVSSMEVAASPLVGFPNQIFCMFLILHVRDACPTGASCNEPSVR